MRAMEGSAGWMAYRAARSNSIRTAFLLRGTLLFFPSSANAVTGISEQKARERGYVRGACGCVWVRDCLRVYERGWLRLEGGREKKKTPEKKMCKRSVYEEPALKRGRRNRERELLVRTSCNHAEPHRNSHASLHTPLEKLPNNNTQAPRTQSRLSTQQHQRNSPSCGR